MVSGEYLMTYALRGLDRWGSSEIVKRAFRGFKALPAADWRAIFKVVSGDSLEIIKTRFHALAAAAHPDKPGGNEHEMQRLNAAWKQAQQELK